MSGKGRVENLQHWAPGESGNPNGRPRGTKSWSTVIRDLLDDPEIADAMLKKKPGWWDKLPNKNAHEAIAMAMAIKATSGDTKAATWLRKTAYGDKIDLTTDGQPVKAVALFDMRAGQAMQLAPIPEPMVPKRPNKNSAQRRKTTKPKSGSAKKTPSTGAAPDTDTTKT